MSARSSSAPSSRNRRFYPLVRSASPSFKIGAAARWLALIAIIQQISCGTGKSPAISNFDPTPVVTVTISPGSAQVSPGGSVQFLVTVQDASNPAVSWQVNGVPGGNSSVGTIAPSGAATASYTAPAAVPATLTVTVTAVLQADATKFGSATVTVNPPSGPQITISPANSSVVVGASVQFTAAVQNAPQAVIWEVDGLQLGNSTVGSISSSGFYTAPATIPSPPAVTITAILQTDFSISGSTTLTVIAPLPSLSVSPTTSNLVAGGTLQLAATVENSSAALIWQISGPGAIVPAGNMASFTAPASVAAPVTVMITAMLETNPPISASAGVTIVPPATFTGVFSWRNDSSLTGQNAQETMLTLSNVNSGQFGKLFACPVDGQIYAQPLYVANVTIPSQGTHNVVYVATEHDSLYAFDADANPCQTLWKVSFINPAEGVTTVPASDIPGETDIVPEIGMTGTPVIDPATATLYVISKTRAIVNGLAVYMHQLHALDLVSGVEKFGGPMQVPPTGIASLTENQRAALLLAGGKIYVGFDSYADTEPFHGWLFAYDAADLQTLPAVFNSTPNGSNGGIGQSGAAPSSDSSGNVFVVTSDGTFDASLGGSDYAETLLKLQTTAANAFTVTDTFTPWNEVTLNLPQKNFGSTGVLLLPDSAGSASHPHLGLAGSEAGSLYLVDRDHLGGFNGPNGPDNVVQTLSLAGSIFGTPSYWAGNNVVYVAAAGDSLRALPVSTGILGSPSCSPPTLCSADTFPFFGASPEISSNGSSNGIVWALDTSGYVTTLPAILHAYDATNLATELYTSPSSGAGAAGLAIKFAVPTVANGKLYVGTQNELSVFGLLP